MSKSTSDLGQILKAADRDHGIVIESPATGEYRAVCLCGWPSAAEPRRDLARAAGVEHLATTREAMREIIREALGDPEVAEAVAALSAEEAAQVYRAAAVAAAGPYVIEAPVRGSE